MSDVGMMRILMVDDNLADVFLAEEALKEAEIPHEFMALHDGDVALEYLAACAGESERRPGLMLLDLNLPRVSGREVLAAVRSDPLMARLPVVILTTSPHEATVIDGQDPSACRYMVKPATMDGLIALMHDIEAFWKETQE